MYTLDTNMPEKIVPTVGGMFSRRRAKKRKIAVMRSIAQLRLVNGFT